MIMGPSIVFEYEYILPLLLLILLFFLLFLPMIMIRLTW